jgi:cytoskeleton protein RodZ
MSSVGAYLRQLREARGVSLEEIARVTRVNPSYLHALESDDYASLPVPVFTRGFIRAYCQALSEPPDQALAIFDGRETAPAPPAAAPAPTPHAPSPSAAPPPPRAASSARTVPEPAPRNRGPVLVSFILLVVLGIALFAVTLALQSGREGPESTRAARSAPGGDSAVAPARPIPPATPATPGAPGTPPSAGPQAARPPGYRLVARTVEPTWIRVRTEDGKTTEETIPAGQVREWSSTGPFTLTIGNAGGIALELNGRAIPPLGASGTVIPRLVLPTESQ